MSAGERVIPFSNGSQSVDWDARNCDRCSKVDYDKGTSNCQLYDALQEAYFTDGTIDAETGKRLGFVDTAYTWDCPERETREGDGEHE
jgi:hypothetical protein